MAELNTGFNKMIKDIAYEIVKTFFNKIIITTQQQLINEYHTIWNEFEMIKHNMKRIN